MSKSRRSFLRYILPTTIISFFFVSKTKAKQPNIVSPVVEDGFDIRNPEVYKLIGVGKTTLSTIIQLDPRIFGAIQVEDNNYSKFDSTKAFQHAIDFAIKNNAKSVIFSGRYLIKGTTGYFVAPSDDGSVFPGWKNAGDIELTPEKIVRIPVSLTIPSGVTLSGKNSLNDELIGDWELLKSDIDEKQSVMLFFTGGNKNTICKYAIKDFTISKSFIGLLVEGISYRASKNNITISNCGIACIEQGVEQCVSENLLIKRCYAGIIRGGWWLHRNDTRLNVRYLPPYPAKDCYLNGWVDDDIINNIVCDVPFVTWDSRFSMIDDYFDIFFYKSQNNKKTSLGGRLTNNSDIDYSVFTPYHGIATRAYCAFSRYGRWIGNVVLSNVKANGNHRPPFYVEQSDYCFIRGAYIERTGYVDPKKKEGSFGDSFRDPLREVGHIHSTVSEGFIHAEAINLVNVQEVNGSGLKRPPSFGIYPSLNSLSSRNNNSVVKSNNRNEMSYIEYNSFYSTTSPPPNKILKKWIKADVSNRAYKDIWVMHEDYQLSPPIKFDTDGDYAFSYEEVAFEPEFIIGNKVANIIINTSIAIRIGKKVTCHLDFSYKLEHSLIEDLNSPIKIMGLPFSKYKEYTPVNITIGRFKCKHSSLFIFMIDDGVLFMKNGGEDAFVYSDLLEDKDGRISITLDYIYG
ncbi:Uncharacterised protein [Serratia fonticola]|uniref:hypothetical protein n=1 Tax=Serratia fonticola TaxID=47917 RepID=UPI002183A279|nr:hypothetical protein [Serratia fonticola]CAI2136824.1 Uncharacterised protein [Serratia fonticola]